LATAAKWIAVNLAHAILIVMGVTLVVAVALRVL